MGKFFAGIGSYTNLIGTVFGGFSTFKLVVDLANLRLSLVVEKLMAFYEAYPLQMVRYPFHLIGWELSNKVANMLLIYLLVCGFLYRETPRIFLLNSRHNIRREPGGRPILLEGGEYEPPVAIDYYFKPIFYILAPFFFIVVYFRGFVFKGFKFMPKNGAMIFTIVSAMTQLFLGCVFFFVFNYAFL